MPPKKNISTFKEFEDEYISKEAQKLTELPKKKGIKAKFMIGQKNAIHQLDTLYFPETKSNYKYVLVCTDVATNTCGAEAMRLRDSNTIVLAYKNILKRKKLKLPILVMSDNGSEFKGYFKTYLNENNVGHQITSRHRQLSPVDRVCAILGKYLNKVMLSEEMKTGKINASAWKLRLFKLVEIINNSVKEPVDIENVKLDVMGKGDILDIDTKVRLSLEHPKRYIDNKKLLGNFRAGDIRWSKEIYTIHQIIMNPSQPVLYMLKDDKNNIMSNVVFTEEQLQVV
jgi:hypothetical protein